VLTWSNRQPIKAAVDTAGGPDVPTDWRATLNQRARDVMVKNDAAVYDAKTYMTPPDVAVSGYRGEKTEPWVPPQGGGTGGGSSPHIPLPPANPPSPAIPSPTSVPGSVSPNGPMLDGGSLPAPPSEPPMFSPIGQPVPNPPGMPSIPPVVPALPVPEALPSGGVFPRVPASGAAAIPPEAGRNATMAEHVIAPGPRPLGPAATPMMMGSGGGARPGMATRGGVRVAPPGGIIAGDGRKQRRDVDPNDPWVVAEGGPAVLTPDPEPAEHSPGPGVLGMDR
jgi:hypothetical protein